MVQNYAYAITLLFMATMAGVFVWVAFSSGGVAAVYEPIKDRAYRYRSWLFFALAGFGVVVPVVTLRPVLYGPNPQHVNAVGHQWYWELTPEKVVAGKDVEFKVTTEDVTHDFAVYDESLHLVAQIQAMPGYTNILHAKFDHPGTYKILCLEYCGLGHHNMMGELHVVAPSAEPSHE